LRIFVFQKFREGTKIVMARRQGEAEFQLEIFYPGETQSAVSCHFGNDKVADSSQDSVADVTSLNLSLLQVHDKRTHADFLPLIEKTRLNCAIRLKCLFK